MSTTTPTQQSQRIKALIAGFTQSPPPGLTTFGINGGTYTVPDLLAKLAAYAATYDAATKAEAEWQTALEARDQVAGDAARLISGARTMLKGALGAKSPALEAFGIEPEKDPTPLTAEQKVAKVQKAKATRAARHTMGPKQKAKITG